MANFAWVKFFFPRYWTKTRHFTCGAQHGIYYNLLGANMFNGPLPTDEHQLFKIAQCRADEWTLHGMKIVAEFFTLTKKGYVNQRAMDVRFDAMKQTKSEVLSESGKRGGLKKAANLKAKMPVDLFPLEGDELEPPIEHGWGADDEATVVPIAYVPTATECKTAVELYNAMAKRAGLAQCAILSDARKKKLKLRLVEAGGIEGWKYALHQVESNAGLCGKNRRRWKASFDFLMQQSSFIKLMEGKYDGWNERSVASDADDAAAVSGRFGVGDVALDGPLTLEGDTARDRGSLAEIIDLAAKRKRG